MDWKPFKRNVGFVIVLLSFDCQIFMCMGVFIFMLHLLGSVEGGSSDC